MALKKHLPNLITLVNLLSGCIAVLYAVFGHLEAAALFVAIGIGFDFFDGFAARLLKVEGALGKQLDSLARHGDFWVGSWNCHDANAFQSEH